MANWNNSNIEVLCNLDCQLRLCLLRMPVGVQVALVHNLVQFVAGKGADQRARVL